MLWIYTPQSADGITFAADGKATVTAEQVELNLEPDIPFISPSLNTAPLWRLLRRSGAVLVMSLIFQPAVVADELCHPRALDLLIVHDQQRMQNDLSFFIIFTA